ncbi:MAG: PAS domain-containing sensor histidine kinase, partial [Proteobacteria bacterium]|nr:PAS domain-containing sensor histidine kinase [Pseudomonadota bacterium]
MSQAAIDPPALEVAFAAFNEQSDLLEECYRALQERIVELTARLRSSQTERHRELLEKERLSNRLSRLLETLPGALLVIDGEGVIFERNNRAAELLNQPLLGCCWSDVVQREFCPNTRVDGDLRLKDGRWLNLFRRPLDSESGEILLLTDVTESRQMTQLLQRHERLSAIGEMTSSLAHQIRTPLSSSLLYLAQIESETTTEEKRRENAAKATRCLRDLDNLVNDMLCFAGGARADGESIKVIDLLRDVFSAIEPQLNDCSYVTVEMFDESLTVTGNREALLGAMLNLVSNAIQSGGSSPVVELSALRVEDQICLTVSDNGCGLSAEVRRRMFEPFYTTRPQ